MNIERLVIGHYPHLCRSGIAALLTEKFAIAQLVQASDYANTLAAIARSRVTTMVTVSLNLPGMNGVAGLRKLRADFPSPLLVVVAESHDRQLVFDALGAGVHGYILKDSPVAEMTEAFETVLSGQIYVPSLVSDVGAATPGDSTTMPARDMLLTRRQHEILKQVAAGRSNKEIARALSIAEGTVKVHVTAAFRALGVHNRVTAAAALNERRRSADLSHAVRGLLGVAPILVSPHP